MGLYNEVIPADSPLFTYYPDPGFNPTQNWITTYRPTAYPLLYYETSSPVASVQFDFYGDTFTLMAPGEPGCAYNITINGELQTQTFHEEFSLPEVAEYRVELDVACAEGESMAFEGVILVGSQGPGNAEDETIYLTPDQILALGEWKEEYVWSQYFLLNFTQYQTLTYGSSLSYSFKGVQATIVGSVGPGGGNYIVTLDGKPSRTLSTVRPVYDDDATLWFQEYLDPGERHEVTITNLGRNLTVLTLNYDVLLPD